MTRSIEYLTGLFIPLNASMTGAEPDQRGFGVSLEIALPPAEAMQMVKGRCYSRCVLQRSTLSVLGCYRDPSWSWWRKPLPAFTLFFLVPIYSFLATMVNLQSYHSRHTPVMVSIHMFTRYFCPPFHPSFSIHHSQISPLNVQCWASVGSKCPTCWESDECYLWSHIPIVVPSFGYARYLDAHAITVYPSALS